jgi:hypothetical protein
MGWAHGGRRSRGWRRRGGGGWLEVGDGKGSMVEEGIVAVWLPLIMSILRILLHNDKGAKSNLKSGGIANISRVGRDRKKLSSTVVVGTRLKGKLKK